MRPVGGGYSGVDEFEWSSECVRVLSDDEVPEEARLLNLPPFPLLSVTRWLCMIIHESPVVLNGVYAEKLSGVMLVKSALVMFKESVGSSPFESGTQVHQSHRKS